MGGEEDSNNEGANNLNQRLQKKHLIDGGVFWRIQRYRLDFSVPLFPIILALSPGEIVPKVKKTCQNHFWHRKDSSIFKRWWIHWAFRKRERSRLHCVDSTFTGAIMNTLPDGQHDDINTKTNLDTILHMKRLIPTILGTEKLYPAVVRIVED